MVALPCDTRKLSAGIIWTTSVSLIACGFVALFFSIFSFHKISHVFVGFYLFAFGILVICSRFNIGFVNRCFGFLKTGKGTALFFIFAGTLGMSFGISAKPGVLVPFIAGICWVAVGVLLFTGNLVLGDSGAAASGARTATVTAVEPV